MFGSSSGNRIVRNRVLPLVWKVLACILLLGTGIWAESSRDDRKPNLNPVFEQLLVNGCPATIIRAWADSDPGKRATPSEMERAWSRLTAMLEVSQRVFLSGLLDNRRLLDFFILYPQRFEQTVQSIILNTSIGSGSALLLLQSDDMSRVYARFPEETAAVSMASGRYSYHAFRLLSHPALAGRLEKEPERYFSLLIQLLEKAGPDNGPVLRLLAEKEWIRIWVNYPERFVSLGSVYEDRSSQMIQNLLVPFWRDEFLEHPDHFMYLSSKLKVSGMVHLEHLIPALGNEYLAREFNVRPDDVIGILKSLTDVAPNDTDLLIQLLQADTFARMFIDYPNQYPALVFGIRETIAGSDPVSLGWMKQKDFSTWFEFEHKSFVEFFKYIKIHTGGSFSRVLEQLDDKRLAHYVRSNADILRSLVRDAARDAHLVFRILRLEPFQSHLENNSNRLITDFRRLHATVGDDLFTDVLQLYLKRGICPILVEKPLKLNNLLKLMVRELPQDHLSRYIGLLRNRITLEWLLTDPKKGIYQLRRLYRNREDGLVDACLVLEGESPARMFRDDPARFESWLRSSRSLKRDRLTGLEARMLTTEAGWRLGTHSLPDFLRLVRAFGEESDRAPRAMNREPDRYFVKVLLEQNFRVPNFLGRGLFLSLDLMRLHPGWTANQQVLRGMIDRVRVEDLPWLPMVIFSSSVRALSDNKAKSKQIGDMADVFRKLNLYSVNRYSPRILEAVYHAFLGEEDASRLFAFALLARYDPRQSFALDRRVYESLLDQGYSLIIAEAESADEWIKRFRNNGVLDRKHDRQPQRYDLVIIGGHGQADNLVLGSPTVREAKIDFRSTTAMELAALHQYLNTGATVALFACSAGSESHTMSDEGMVYRYSNLMEMFACVLDTKVLAPRTDTGISHFIYSDQGKVQDVEYWDKGIGNESRCREGRVLFE